MGLPGFAPVCHDALGPTGAQVSLFLRPDVLLTGRDGRRYHLWLVQNETLRPGPLPETFNPSGT